MNYKVLLVIALVMGGFVALAYHHPAASIPAPQTKQSVNAVDNRLVCVYFIYKGAGAEDDMSSYDTTTTAPLPCGGNDVICFFRICDDNGTVTPAEFAAAFAALNVIDPGSNLLSDEDEIPGELEKYTLSR